MTIISPIFISDLSIKKHGVWLSTWTQLLFGGRILYYLKNNITIHLEGHHDGQIADDKDILFRALSLPHP